MPNGFLIGIVLVTPFLGAMLSPLAYRWFNRKGIFVPLFSALIPLFSLILLLREMAQTSLPIYISIPWVADLPLELAFLVDGFSGLFALMVVGMGVLIIWYSHHYMEKEEGQGRFFSFLLFFMGSMVGVALGEHMLTTFLFWELTSISSFLLIGFWHHKERSRYGALKSLVITGGGGLFMLAGMALLGTKTGQWEWSNISAISSSVNGQNWFTWAFLLIILGVLTKSAQFPFHIWLPDAMEAPTPVSAYLHSATMVKAGVFLLFKLYPIFHQHLLWFPLLATIGMTTFLIGAVLALKHTDLKAILAYTTIGQLGLFVVMHAYSFNDLAIRASLIFHIFVHAFYKGSLFMLAGIIDHNAHTRDIRNLGHLKKYMPRTCFFLLLAAGSLAGLPPFLGFLSKEGAIQSSLHAAHLYQGWAWLLPVTLVMSALITVGVALKISFGLIFPGPINSQHLKDHPPHEAKWSFLFPPALLAVLGLIFGLYPQGLATLLYPVGLINIPGADMPHFALWHGLNTPLFLSSLAVAGGILVYWKRHQIQLIHQNLKFSWNLNTVYDKSWEKILAWAESLTNLIQNGSMTRYLGIALTFITGLLALTVWLKPNWSDVKIQTEMFYSLESLVSIGIVFSSLLVVLLKDRIARIISLGTIGILICVYFTFRAAPDLALTGFLVEIIMFILVLIVLKQLDKEKLSPQSRGERITIGLIGSFGGAVIGVIVFIVLKFPLAPTIADYFLKNADTLAGGDECCKRYSC